VLVESGRDRPYADSAPLQVRELWLDPPGAGELLVAIHAAGLCHSDLSTINGSRPRPLPMAMGHEAAGEVVEIGPDVEEFAPGDRVVLTFVPACGRCRRCVASRPALCEPGGQANRAGTLLGGGMRLVDEQGRRPYHHLGVSGFAEYAVVSARSCVAVDAELPYDVAALFGCAVLTGAGAVFNTADVHAGETVAVFGLGGVGLAALLGAKAAGAGTLIAVDPVADKRRLALELGATHALGAQAVDVVAAIRELTDGGVDKAVDSTGVPAALADA
jgi:alcohol dehydrogenase